MPEVERAIDRETKDEPWTIVELVVKYRYPESNILREKSFTLDRRNIEAEHIERYREQYEEIKSSDPGGEERVRGRPTPDDFADNYQFEDFEKAVISEAQRLLDEPILERGESTNEFRIFPSRVIQEVTILVKNRSTIVLPN